MGAVRDDFRAHFDFEFNRHFERRPDLYNDINEWVYVNVWDSDDDDHDALGYIILTYMNIYDDTFFMDVYFYVDEHSAEIDELFFYYDLQYIHDFDFHTVGLSLWDYM